MASKPVLIRLAKGCDAGALTALYRELTGDDAVWVEPARLDALARGSSTKVLVAEADGEVAGTAWLGFCEDVMFRAQPFAVLENVVVKASRRGQGIGEALLGEAERLCVQADCSKMMLLSSARREAAHRFFQRSGFQGDAKRGFVKYRSKMGISN
ncbi:GNAT family N-acetyltransferase [Chromobacterium sp. IIBBL 290-4]|uniref:GNAT family N-acetyltransferase n=1 Tax=Chromobacterium sp. IIBBL 290-4 TaxID=2953890 RepID=UPI0020B69D81|nr:GNAT family N-acetyltransferase [Chromobacterium sp. IIBBL 290-4]UTH73385.1 GNAT family N-acetyltransferase [Chromobacterium sp. IIBBL 290-4]